MIAFLLFTILAAWGALGYLSGAYGAYRSLDGGRVASIAFALVWPLSVPALKTFQGSRNLYRKAKLYHRLKR